MTYANRGNTPSILPFGLFLLAAVAVVLASVYFPIRGELHLAGLLVIVTAYYTYAALSQVALIRKANVAAIRPYIVATRLSPSGEIGLFAGSEGMNRDIYVMNVGSGHAHQVNIRIDPPAEAYATREDGRVFEELPTHYVLDQLEFPKGTKRLWSAKGGFCKPGEWRYMYAEYDDIDGNHYYTIQSGYSVRTGSIHKLAAGRRKGLSDPLWNDEERPDWLKEIEQSLMQWAIQEKGAYERRSGRDAMGSRGD